MSNISEVTAYVLALQLPH